MPEPVRIQDIAVPATLVLILFFVALIIPVLGVVIGIFSPVPLIYVYLQRGRETGLAGIAAVALVLLIFFGIRHAVFFLAEYGILAAILSETIRMRLPVDRSAFLGALGTGFASGILLYLTFSGSDGSVVDFLKEQIKGHLLQSMEAIKDVSKGDEALEVWDEAMIDSLAGKFALAYPAFIYAGCMFASLVNYGVAGLFWRRLGGSSGYFADRFSLWSLPETSIWALIGSSAAVWFLDAGVIYAVGLNLLILSSLVYCLQGAAIAIFFLEARAIPFFLWIVLFLFIFTQPLLIGILIGMGVFDLWADFRKLKPKLTPDSEEDEEED